MKRLGCMALVAAGLLAGCGGGGGSDTGGVTSPPPVANIPPVAFKDVTGTASADAGLGQSFNVQWVLPAGVSLSSVVLDATAMSGLSPAKSNCLVNAGAIAVSATSANITIPNVCEARTVNEVRLRITVECAGGQRTSATHSFVAPSEPAEFLPQLVQLPVLRITTDNGAPIVSKEVYISGQMSLVSNVAGVAAVNGGLQIRGRGNSTWSLHPKKPYRLKLTDKQALLGMPSSKEWVLLANYSDKTLLRNAAALDLGTRMGFPWTPRSAFVEVYLNDRYDGVYQCGPAAGCTNRAAPWFSRLFEDPAFAARVKTAWNEIKADELPAVFQAITTSSASLQQAQLNNFERWPILEMYVWPNYRVPGSYRGEIDNLNNWLTARIAWMDGQINP